MHNRMRTMLMLLAGAAVSTSMIGCEGHGNYTGAFKEEAELRLASLKAATEWERAQQQFLAGDLDKALTTVERSISYLDTVGNAHRLRGRILMEMGRLEAALISLDRAIQYDPTNAEAYYFRGIVFERISRPDEAYQSYVAADEHDPTNAQYILAAAEMLIETDQLDAAWSMLQARTSDFEHNPGIRQTLGHLATMRGDVDGAINYFQEAHLLAPDDPFLVEDLARAQIGAGYFAEAEYNIRRILNDPDTSSRRDLKHLQVRCLLELDRPVEARTILESLVADQAGANDVTAWVELGNIACILDDQRKLREVGQRLLAFAPERYEGHIFMAIWSRSSGRLENALHHAQAGVVRAPGMAGPLAMRGLIEFELGRNDASLRSFRHALQLAPEDQAVQRLAQYVELRSYGR